MIFTANAPSSWRGLVCALAVLSTLANRHALAQTEGEWTEPGQRFSLELRALGWSEFPPSGDGEIGAIEHREFQANGLMRTCFINEQRQAIPSTTPQANLNAAATARGVGGLQEIFGGPIIRSRLIEVDGIPVLDAVFGGSPYRHVRAFYLKDGAEVAQIVVTCGATAPVSEEVTQNISALLDTLRIRTR